MRLLGAQRPEGNPRLTQSSGIYWETRICWSVRSLNWGVIFKETDVLECLFLLKVGEAV